MKAGLSTASAGTGGNSPVIEAIQVIRDVVIILGFVVITSIVVLVGWKALYLMRKVENAGKFAAAAVANPVKGVRGLLLALRHQGAKR